jgi:RNA polymerase sigma-70 factor, ECF subfamily
MIRELEFKLLCHRHGDEIYRYARSFLGNSADAEDATQEALFRLWQNIADVPFLHARPWLFRTTRNLCLDQIRRRNARYSPVAVGDDTLEAVPDDSVADPVQQADSAFHTGRLNHAIQRLPETLRSVFVLYELHDLRYRDIAETLDLPLNTVKVYLSRARTRLQQLLTEDPTWTKS